MREAGVSDETKAFVDQGGTMTVVVMNQVWGRVGGGGGDGGGGTLHGG